MDPKRWPDKELGYRRNADAKVWDLDDSSFGLLVKDIEYRSSMCAGNHAEIILNTMRPRLQ